MGALSLEVLRWFPLMGLLCCRWSSTFQEREKMEVFGWFKVKGKRWMSEKQGFDGN